MGAYTVPNVVTRDSPSAGPAPRVASSTAPAATAAAAGDYGIADGRGSGARRRCLSSLMTSPMGRR